MTPANLALRIDQGATFRALLRLMQPNPVYKPITGIAPTGPVRLTVEHGLPGDWPVWVEHVRQLPEANRAPLRQLPHMAQVVTATELDLPGINATGTRPEGGQLVYRPPLDLTDATAELRLYEKGAEVGTLPVSVNAGGWVDVELSAAETDALAWHSREYVLDVTLPNGDVLRAYTGTITVEVAGAAAGQVCHGFATAGGDRGQRGAQVVGSTFDEEGRLIMTLDDGSMVASDPSPVVETVIEATDTAVAAAGESVSASNAAAEARNEALAASVTAGEKADQSANSASEAAASEAVATAKAFEAENAADRAETARDASLLSKGVWPTTAAGIGQGVAGTSSLVAGSGGTNGTFDLAFSGGTQVLAPKGRFVVAGGAVSQVIIDYPGYYSAGTPTISFAASSGLTGASVSAVMGPNTPVGSYFSTPGAGAKDGSTRYRVGAGPVAELDDSFPNADAVEVLGDFADYDGKNLVKWVTPLRKLLLAIRFDGTLISKLGIALGVSNGLGFVRQADGTYSLSLGDREGALPLGDAELDGAADNDRWLYVVRSPLKRWMFGITRGGAVRIAKLDHPVVASSASTERYFARVEQDDTGWYQLRVFDRSTGMDSIITSGPTAVAAVSIDRDRYVVFATVQNEQVLQTAYDLEESEYLPVQSVTNFSLWGDSLTEPGTGYGGVFAALVPDYEVSNEGIGGQRAYQIAARMGALKNSANNITITGGEIPASGPAACSPSFFYAGPPTSSFSAQGEIAGVVGTLTTSVSGAGVITTVFTRSEPGSAVPVTTPAVFTPSTGVSLIDLSTLRSRITFLCVGTNDLGKPDYSQSAVLSNIAAMVENLRAICPKFLILGLTNSYGNLPVSQGGLRADDTTSQLFMDQINSLNYALEQEYGELYFNTQQTVVDAGPSYSSEFTVGGETYRVLTDVVSSDGIHYTATGKSVISSGILSRITSKGWIQ